MSNPQSIISIVQSIEFFVTKRKILASLDFENSLLNFSDLDSSSKFELTLFKTS